MKRILLLFVMASFTGLWALAADITPEQAPAVTSLSIVNDGTTGVDATLVNSEGELIIILPVIP